MWILGIWQGELRVTMCWIIPVEQSWLLQLLQGSIPTSMARRPENASNNNFRPWKYFEYEIMRISNTWITQNVQKQMEINQTWHQSASADINGDYMTSSSFNICSMINSWATWEWICKHHLEAYATVINCLLVYCFKKKTTSIHFRNCAPLLHWLM